LISYPASGLHVLGVDDGVADQSDGAGNGFQLLSRDFENGGGEEPGDPVVALGASQTLGEEAVVEALLPG